MLTHAAPSASVNPVLAAWGGTLHLDAVERLDHETQRLLLCLVHQLQSDQAGALRLSAGAGYALEDAMTEGRVLPSLYDGLDKIRFELDSPVAA